MKKVIKLLSLVSILACSGCAMISYDRVMPKLTWAWTDQAKEQRRQDRERDDGIRAYQDSLKTNTASVKQ